MAQIRVFILDHTGGTKTEVEVPDDVPMTRLLPALVDEIGLPLKHGATEIRYRLEKPDQKVRIGDSETLAAAGVKPGEILTLLPEVTAGGESPSIRSEQLELIDAAIESVSGAKSQATRDIDVDTTERDYLELLKDLREQISLQERVQRIQPPILEVPTPQQMKVKLVPAHLLSWLEETRADEKKWSSVGWAFLGGILGLAVNLLTAEQPTLNRATIVLAISLSIVVVLALASSRVFALRAAALRAEILDAGIHARTEDDSQ